MIRQSILRQRRALTAALSRPVQTHRTPFSSLSSPSSPVSRIVAVSPSVAARGRRWQSDDASKKSGDASAETKPAEATEQEALKKELEAKNKEIKDLKDSYLRSVADYRNLENRTRRDMEAARQFAIQKFANDLLDSIDNLDRALTSVPVAALAKAPASPENEDSNASAPNSDLINLHSGLKMTEEILMSTLKKHGLERYDPLTEGRKFDPNLDEATFFAKQEGKEDGDVFFTQSKGYILNGRVIRAAKVGVVKNS
ncbi:hypothetical protein DV735_g3967, partial [Chaetothyriales sp. CBS 134920]